MNESRPVCHDEHTDDAGRVWICTLDPGHDGAHAAVSFDKSTVYFTWPRAEPEPTPSS